MQENSSWLANKGISHRGVKRDGLRENSLEAFSSARELGFRHFETDLRCSANGAIYLCHDATLTRLAHDARSISQLTNSELAKIKLKYGNSLARFEELVHEFTENRFIFDIKPESGFQTIDSLARWTKNNKDAEEWLRQQARFLFWRLDQQKYFSKLFSGMVCLPRENQCWRAGLSTLAHMPWLGGIQAGSSYAVPYKLAGKVLLNARTIDAYHRRGAKVIAYLPPIDTQIINQIDAAGADEILIDDIPL